MVERKIVSTAVERFLMWPRSPPSDPEAYSPGTVTPSPETEGVSDTAETNVKPTWALRGTQTRKGKAQWMLTKENDVVQVPAVGPSGVQSGNYNSSPGLRGVSDTAETNVKATWALRDTQTRKVEAQGC